MSLSGLPAIIEKPIVGLTSFTSSLWTNWISQAINGGMSNEFIELVKSISEVKSQQEEVEIISREVKALKKLSSQPEFTDQQLKEFIIRLIYCEMLGHNVRFGYIKVMQATQKKDMLLKRTEDSDLSMLLTSSMLRDIYSSNYMEIWCSLCCMCNVVYKHAVEAYTATLLKLLSHEKPLIRKKVVSVIHKFWTIYPEAVEGELQEKAFLTLGDKDPSVMAACVAFYFDVVKRNPKLYKFLIQPFLVILKQLADNNLPKTYEFYGVSAPWTQIKILRILGMLGAGDRSASELIYGEIEHVMKAADVVKNNGGYAIIYEAVKTIVTIFPNKKMLDFASTYVSTLMQIPSPNIRYLGLKSLTNIIEFNSNYATEHQITIIDCLDHSDEIIRRRTIDLLCKMATTNNVAFIIEKLLETLKSSMDNHFKRDLLCRIFEIAEKQAPNGNWFVDTVGKFMILAGNLIEPSLVNRIIKALDGCEAKSYASEKFIEISKMNRLSDSLIEVITWIIGEYSPIHLMNLQEPIDRLCDLLDKTQNPFTRCSIVTSLIKLSAKSTQTFPEVIEVIDRISAGASFELSQRCSEARALIARPKILKNVAIHPPNELFDPSLSFLNSFVSEDLRNGGKKYKRPEERTPVIIQQAPERKLRYARYESPKIPTHKPSLHSNIQVSQENVSIEESPIGKQEIQRVDTSPQNGIQVKRRSIWTSEGYNPELPKKEEKVPETKSTPITSPKSVQPTLIPQNTAQTPISEEKEKMRAALFGVSPIDSDKTPISKGIIKNPETPSLKSQSPKVTFQETKSNLVDLNFESKSNSNSNAAKDLFGSLLLEDPTPILPAPVVVPAPITPKVATSPMQLALEEVAVSPSLVIKWGKIFNEKDCTVALYLENKSADNLTNLVIQMELPPTIIGIVDEKIIENNYSFPVDFLGSYNSLTRYVSLRIKKHAAPSFLKARTKYNINERRESRSLGFTAFIEVSDFLRPLSWSPSEFELAWKNLKQERKIALNLANSEIDTIARKLKCYVSTKGDDLMLSGQILDSVNEICLIMVSLNKEKASVVVRTSDISFTDSVVWSLQRLQSQ